MTKNVRRTFAPWMAFGFIALFGATACNDNGSPGTAQSGPVVSQNTPAPGLGEPFAQPQPQPPAGIPQPPAPLPPDAPTGPITTGNLPSAPSIPVGPPLPAAPAPATVAGMPQARPQAVPAPAAPAFTAPELPVTPPAPIIEAKADLSLIGYDVVRVGLGKYRLDPSGVTMPIKTKEVHCHVTNDRIYGKSLFITITLGSYEIAMSLPHFSPAKTRYRIPEGEGLDRGMLMFKADDKVRFSAMSSNGYPELDTDCKVDVSAEGGKLIAMVDCKKMQDAKMLEEATLAGNFTCPISE